MGYHLSDYFKEFLHGAIDEEDFLKRFALTLESNRIDVKQKASIMLSCMIDAVEGLTYASKVYDIIKTWESFDNIFIMIDKGWNQYELAGQLPKGWELKVKRDETNG